MTFLHIKTPSGLTFELPSDFLVEIIATKMAAGSVVDIDQCRKSVNDTVSVDPIEALRSLDWSDIAPYLSIIDSTPINFHAEWAECEIENSAAQRVVNLSERNTVNLPVGLLFDLLQRSSQNFGQISYSKIDGVTGAAFVALYGQHTDKFLNMIKEFDRLLADGELQEPVLKNRIILPH